MTPAGDDPRTWPVKRVESYGGIVVRPAAGDFEVALIRPASDDGKVIWALPKGAADPDEAPERAAYREVLEETGLDADLEAELEPITYWFSWAADRTRYRKTVRFFLMRIEDGNASPDGIEVAEVRFVPLHEAHAVATYASERKVLRAAAQIVRETW